MKLKNIMEEWIDSFKDSGITIQDIYMSVFPYVGIQAVCLAIVIAFPQIALWLPAIWTGGPV